ncbi:hypothetical protein FQN54_001223 [Arachnomyces sp. PD_36]|nr:hypothetical protein FQN54_001223 [Arachnomyces sp. PD_36]
MARFTFLLTTGLAATVAAGPLDARWVVHENSIDPTLGPNTPSATPPSEPTEAPSTAATTATATTPDPAAVCSGDTSTTDGVQKILDDSGAIAWLDIMLFILDDNGAGNGKGEHDWVNQLWLSVFNDDGGSPLTGCGKIGSDCNVETSCSEYPNAMSYWVFKTVSMLHSKVNTVRSNLLWTGWLDGLSIDQIAEDFELPVPDSSWLKWISAAFSMAGSVAPGGKVVEGMTSMAVSAMNAAADDAEDEDNFPQVDTTSVQNTLKNVVGAAGEKVASILENATGNGDSKKLPLLNHDTYQYATSSFFADNTLLLDENKDKESFVSIYDSFIANLERKLVDEALKTSWYLFLADTDISSEDDCTGEEYRFWHETKPGKFYCFYWTALDYVFQCEGNEPSTCYGPAWNTDRFDEEFYNKLEKYGFDLKSYHESLIDCELNGTGEVEMDNFVNDVPRCYYSSYVRTGSWGLDAGLDALGLDDGLKVD